MKAFVLDHYRKNGRLTLTDVDAPRAGQHDVVVEIHAAGVNLVDAKIRDGEFKLVLPYKLPIIMGNDVAGVVTQVGSQVSAFKPGDTVYARPDTNRIGTFAESIAIHERDVAHAPANLTIQQAASIPLVALTAWQALIETARLTAGQKVFIQAGSGGVGTVAIQLAKHLGATVATTCSPASFDLVRGLGADVVIDYKSQDFETELSGYDVVLHSQDTAALTKSLRILKPGGILVSISGPPDPAFAEQVGAPWFVGLALRALSRGVRAQAKRLGVRYSFLFMRADGEQLQEITGLIESGVIRPLVDRAFDFEATNEALAYVETGRTKGKVVIAVKQQPDR
ncbi:NADP-dependent oxidoreductase [Mycolicibacterium vinylchloridicum]|uniref:NADP-dependent oxidoreductase n=1 Tax=Mycolicibacterium vinylchloridicum TaxID=2736928 RepID=UPI0015CE148C|nr:NADP-dependent oxidoreductase [Mycolicibacterium vinylchloridicum]